MVYFYNRWFSRAVLPIIFLMFISLNMVGYAFAHKVSIFAWVEGDMVYTQSKFSGGKKVQNAPVEVFDAKGDKLVEGKTDDNGEFSFKVPQRTEMQIILLAGMGHRAQWTIPVEELGESILQQSGDTSLHEPGGIKPGAVQPDDINQSQPDEVGQDNLNKPETLVRGSTQPCACLTPDDIENIVEKTLDKKLGPIITMLNKSLDPDHAPGVFDILGGIGYILGLVGVGAYFNYRKKVVDKAHD